jgi:DoxX-like family
VDGYTETLRHEVKTVVEIAGSKTSRLRYVVGEQAKLVTSCGGSFPRQRTSSESGAPSGWTEVDQWRVGDQYIGGSVIRKIAYWTSTAIVALALLAALSYLTGSEQVVSGFAKAGYPQHLRIVLGIVKPAAAIVLLLPGFPLLKEWAYAGVVFTWTMAFISAYTGGEQTWPMPLVLLALLILSYVTRPAGRRLIPLAAST